MNESNEDLKIEVLLAEPYRPMELGSFGKATYMLLRQHKFPHFYERHVDEIMSVDHDRCLMWDREHATRCFKEHGSNEMSLERWVQSASSKRLFAFLIDILKAEECHPGVKWTGFRIMGTVNRSNGYPVWSFDLFANKSKTKVYSEGHAPNVKGFSDREKRFLMDNMGGLIEIRRFED